MLKTWGEKGESEILDLEKIEYRLREYNFQNNFSDEDMGRKKEVRIWVEWEIGYRLRDYCSQKNFCAEEMGGKKRIKLFLAIILLKIFSIKNFFYIPIFSFKP